MGIIKYVRISAALFLLALFVNTGYSAGTKSDGFQGRVYVDTRGRLRQPDGKEGAWFGVNYTLPFAHAWREINRRGYNPDEVAGQDVEHFARLGLNGFRLHLWDVELADSLGNLLDNEHLRQLDKLLALLENKGIDIILTAQTNFGNGYPEKNIDTGGYSYDYDKCDVHHNPAAIKIQENYLRQLVQHINPFTGKSYAEDPNIIAIEINNEPCHKNDKKGVEKYIRKATKALRRGGYKGVVLYNVSHNREVVDAYYKVDDVAGTTYQWYPDGLVAGHKRSGNYLPVVGAYSIPWADSVPGFNKKARVVYEFDPGDMLSSYMYPAIARTFKENGFQWATQFAYDPTPIAPYNTEYQTHYLNLLHTPSKAMSLAVAAEVMRNVETGNNTAGVMRQNWPQDTLFGDFRLRYQNDLSEFNSAAKWIYTNTTDSRPKDIDRLAHIWGVGSSAVVDYAGTGAYFLDRVSGDSLIWRLEIMPDVVILSDPFEKPSTQKEVSRLFYGLNPIRIQIPELGEDYYYTQIADTSRAMIQKNVFDVKKAEKGTFNAAPGVYLLSKSELPSVLIESISVAENPYCAKTLNQNETSRQDVSKQIDGFLQHTATKYLGENEDLYIKARWFGEMVPDSVLVYPEGISFWNADNTLYPMQRLMNNQDYLTNEYAIKIPFQNLDKNKDGRMEYNIVVFYDGKKECWPQEKTGTPLDWDFISDEKYSVRICKSGEPIELWRPKERDKNVDYSTIPDDWRFQMNFFDNLPDKPKLVVKGDKENPRLVIMRRYVGDEFGRHPYVVDSDRLFVDLESELPTTGELALYLKNGDVVGVPVIIDNKGICSFEINDFRPVERYVVPAPYPVFLPRVLPVNKEARIENWNEVEFIEFRFPDFGLDGNNELSFGGAWMN